MSAPQEVAEALLQIQTAFKESNKCISGINVDHDHLMTLMTLIRINAGIIRSWSIRETT